MRFLTDTMLVPLGHLSLMRLLFLSVLVCGFACSDGDLYSDSSDPKPNIDVEDTVAGLGDLVSVHYVGTLDSGEEFDSSRDRGPLSFTIGNGEVIKGFEKAVLGLRLGETIKVRIEPSQAYGEHKDELVIEIDTAHLPKEVKVGSTVEYDNRLRGAVVDRGELVTRIDLNHKLAGQALIFEIELLGID